MDDTIRNILFLVVGIVVSLAFALIHRYLVKNNNPEEPLFTPFKIEYYVGIAFASFLAVVLLVYVSTLLFS